MADQDMSWCESGYISHHTTANQMLDGDDSTMLNSATYYDEDDTITEQPTSLECVNVQVVRDTVRSTNSTTSTISLLFGSFTECIQPMRSALSSIKEHFNPYIIHNGELDLDLQRDYYCHGMEGTILRTKYQRRDVAVKRLLNPKFFNPHLIEELARLQHDSIVQFLGYTISPPQYVMEFLPHGTLDMYLRNGGEIQPKLLIRWSSNIADGLVHLHSINVIHCDLKSANLMIDKSGQRLKIIDMESCLIVPDNADRVPVTRVRGTTPYMSPEMIKQLPCTTMADIWAFGVILWEMVTLKTPYKNMADEYVFYGIGMNKISLPINEDIPEGIKLLLQLCWKQAPEARPAAFYIKKHLEELAKELDRTSSESYRQSQMSWREDCDYQKYEYDPREIDQWTRRNDLNNYRVLQMRYSALVTSYNNLYQEFKELKKDEKGSSEKGVKLFTRKRNCSKKSKKKHDSSLLFSSSNHVITRAVSAPQIKQGSHGTIERECITRQSNTLDTKHVHQVQPSHRFLLEGSDTDHQLEYTSPIDSDSSRSSKASARLGDIESGPESADQDRIIFLPQKANQYSDDEDSALSLSSQIEIRDLRPIMSSSILYDEFGEESLDNFGVKY